MTREALLTRTFVEFADTLVAQEFDVVELLTTLADRCVEILDVAAAGLMLVAPEGDLRVIASSSEAMRLVELYELQAEEGPCLDCYNIRQPVLNEHLDQDRWPAFQQVALSAGFHTVHALPMRLRQQVIGALNLFHTSRQDLDAEDVVTGQALADAATITIMHQRAANEDRLVNAQLQEALNTRVVIEQAKGLIVGRTSLDMDAAFSRIRTYARNHNRKLSETAANILDERISLDELIGADGAGS